MSIKMAKDQNLALNPQKVSGVCGRLLCCLTYEQETYRELRRGLPKIGKRVYTPNGEGRGQRYERLAAGACACKRWTATKNSTPSK